MSDKQIISAENEQKESPPEQAIGFSIEAHPITGQPLIGILVRDKTGAEATVRLSAEDSIHVAAKLNAFGQFLFGQEQAMRFIQQSQGAVGGV